LVPSFQAIAGWQVAEQGIEMITRHSMADHCAGTEEGRRQKDFSDGSRILDVSQSGTNIVLRISLALSSWHVWSFCSEGVYEMSSIIAINKPAVRTRYPILTGIFSGQPEHL